MGVLQIISASFLGYGINRIRTIIKLSGEIDLLNVSILVQHFLVFGLYILSTMTLYYTFAHYYLFDGSFFVMCVSIAVSNVLSFFEQLCICHILWQLARRPIEPEPLSPSTPASDISASSGSKLAQPLGVPETVEYDVEQEV